MITTHTPHANARVIDIEYQTVALYCRLGVMVDAPRAGINKLSEEELKLKLEQKTEFGGFTIVEEVEALKRLRDLRRRRRTIERVTGRKEV